MAEHKSGSKSDKVPTIVDVLGILDTKRELKDVPPPVDPNDKEAIKKRDEFQLMSLDEKRRTLWLWKTKGIPADAMARSFGISVSEVYRMLSDIRKEFRKRFEGETAADLLAEHLMHLQAFEEICLYETAQLGRDGKEFDPKLGKVIQKKTAQQELANKVKFAKLAVECRKLQIDTAFRAGIIPTAPERMYRSLEQEGKVPSADDTKKTRKGTDRKVLIEEILANIEATEML